MARDTSLLHFYVYDSFNADYKANRKTMLQNMTECYLSWQLSMFASYHEGHR